MFRPTTGRPDTSATIPMIRHGGGGPQTADEPHRLEHLRRFVATVATRVASGGDLLILGPGTVRRLLIREIAEQDLPAEGPRDLACQASPPLTDRQLVARLRTFAGANVRRRGGVSHRKYVIRHATLQPWQHSHRVARWERRPPRERA